MRTGSARIVPRILGPAAAVVAAGALAVAPSSPALAAGASATGPEGQKLTVSKTSGLDPDGETVTVSGTGYNTEKGVYVAFCVDNGPKATPTPCIGGVDMSGESGASVWISSNPPSYGKGLAKAYQGTGHDGTFSVSLKVRAKDANTDCGKAGVTCAVITRNDHTRGGDQSQTVRVPVAFGTAAASSGASGAASGGAADGPAAAASPTSGAAAGDEVTDGDDGSLASTGADLARPLGLAAAGLVAAGGAVWFAARRRTRASAGRG